MTPRRRDKAGFRRFFRYLEETGLVYPLRKRALRHGATLHDVYGDERAEAATAARIEAWWYLVAETRRSPEQVAELFDRSASSVRHGLRLLRERADELTVSVAPDTVFVLAGRAAAAGAITGGR